MMKLLQINKSKPLKGRENNCVGKQKLTRHSQSLAYFFNALSCWVPFKGVQL